MGNWMMPGDGPDSSTGGTSGAEAHSEPREPSAESSLAPSALEQRAEELIEDNLKARKGALGDGQEVSEVRQAVEQDFQILNKTEEFLLIKNMEEETNKKGA
jgi:hypothetical protein